MLVERGLLVMHMEVVDDAYAIASNYLRQTGAVTCTVIPDVELLEIIVGMFHRGEHNRIRLANKAIAKFEAIDWSERTLERISWKPPSTVSCKPMRCW
jgi:hypothetical protein